MNPVAFLQKAFAGRDGFVAVTAIVPDGLTETKAVPIDKIGTLASFIKAHNGQKNLYWGVNRIRTPLHKKATKGDVATLDFLHVDLDPRDGYPFEQERDRIKALLDATQPKPNIVIDSGAGYGAFWRLREPPIANGNIADLEAYSARLAQTLGGDHCWNIDRLMRLPGTTNLPTKKKVKKGRGIYEAHLVHIDGGAYDLSDFDRLRPPQNDNEQPKKTAAGLPLRVVALAKVAANLRKRLNGDTTGLNDTTRSGLDFAVASLLVRARLYDDEIAATLRAYGHGKACEESDGYITRILTKLRTELGEPAAHAPFAPEIINAATLQTMALPELRWIIPKLLPEGLTILAGRPKQGKSRMALNIGAALAAGGKALGWIPVEQCGVLMLALVDSSRRL